MNLEANRAINFTLLTHHLFTILSRLALIQTSFDSIGDTHQARNKVNALVSFAFKALILFSNQSS